MTAINDKIMGIVKIQLTLLNINKIFSVVEISDFGNGEEYEGETPCLQLTMTSY